MISRLLGDERGVALIMATAFMLLSIPLTIAALQLASTLARTSQTQTGFLLSQYSTQGAQEYILHVLSASSTPSSGTSTLTINGRTVTTSVLKLLTPPTDLPITSFKTKLLTTKEASPTSISPSATTTYTITVENKHRKKVDFKKVVDELPRGFTYAPNSSVLVVAGGAPITPDEPTLKDGELKWTIAAGTKLQVGESATLTFTAVAPPETGRYCNEVYAEKGGKKTRSGKTAIVTVEPNTDTECTGTAVSLYKTVSPE